MGKASPGAAGPGGGQPAAHPLPPCSFRERRRIDGPARERGARWQGRTCPAALPPPNRALACRASRDARKPGGLPTATSRNRDARRALGVPRARWLWPAAGDAGGRARPVTPPPAAGAVDVSSSDLEDGNASKGLPVGVGGRGRLLAVGLEDGPGHHPVGVHPHDRRALDVDARSSARDASRQASLVASRTTRVRPLGMNGRMMGVPAAKDAPRRATCLPGRRCRRAARGWRLVGERPYGQRWRGCGAVRREC